MIRLTDLRAQLNCTTRLHEAETDVREEIYEVADGSGALRRCGSRVPIVHEMSLHLTFTAVEATGGC